MRPALHRWRLLLFGSFSILLGFGIFGQDVTPAFDRALFIAGESDGIAEGKVAAAVDGGFYFFARAARPLIKFSSNFEIQWEIARRAGSNDIDVVSAVASLPQGDILVLLTCSSVDGAHLYGAPASRDHQYIVRLTAAGALVSSRDVSGAVISALAATGDGGFAIAGFGNGIAHIGADQFDLGTGGFFLARFNDALINVRVGPFTLGKYNYISSIHADRSGDLFIAGPASASSWSFGGTNLAGPGVFAARINSAGAAEWARMVAPGVNFATTAKNLDGPALMSWRSTVDGSVVCKLDMDGTTLWQKTFQGEVKAVTPDAPDFVAGVEYPGQNTFLLALNAQGEISWRKGEASRAWNAPKDISVLSDGSIVMAGEITPAGAFFDEFFLRDFDRFGTSSSAAFLIGLNPAKPSFRVQPKSQAGLARGEVMLRAEVYSPSPSSYQWRKNNEPIALQTTPQLRLQNLQPGDAATYTLLVSTANGDVLSMPARVTVNTVEVTTLASGLNLPRNPVALPDGRILFVESSIGSVRVLSNGVVANFPVPTARPKALAVQPFSTAGPMMLVADGLLNGLRSVQLADVSLDVTAVGPIEGSAQFQSPNSVATSDGLDYFIVSETNGTRVLKFKDGDQNIVTGGTRGFADGIWEQAKFQNINAVAVDARGNIYVADKGNHAIRKVTLDGKVVTFAGTNAAGFSDGIGTEARLNEPSGLTIDSDGNVFVTDSGNSSIVRISPFGDVTTLSSAGQFSAPEGITILPDGSLVIADTGNNRIRRLRFVPATTAETRLAVSRTGGLTITVTGSASAYQIESASRLGADADWGFEAFADLGVPQILAVPDQIRFYRAIPVN